MVAVLMGVKKPAEAGCSNKKARRGAGLERGVKIRFSILFSNFGRKETSG